MPRPSRRRRYRVRRGDCRGFGDSPPAKNSWATTEPATPSTSSPALLSSQPQHSQSYCSLSPSRDSPDRAGGRIARNCSQTARSRSRYCSASKPAVKGQTCAGCDIFRLAIHIQAKGSINRGLLTTCALAFASSIPSPRVRRFGMGRAEVRSQRGGTRPNGGRGAFVCRRESTRSIPATTRSHARDQTDEQPRFSGGSAAETPMGGRCIR